MRNDHGNFLRLGRCEVFEDQQKEMDGSLDLRNDMYRLRAKGNCPYLSPFLNDGTWKCEDTVYLFRLELNGKMPNAKEESQYVVLTDDDTLDFEKVVKSQYSSDIEDGRVMEGSVIVEMR